MKGFVSASEEEKQRIAEILIEDRVSKREMQKILRHFSVVQKTVRHETISRILYPVAGKGFQTDGTVYELADLPKEISPTAFVCILWIETEEKDRIAEATGYSIPLIAFIDRPEQIMDVLDSRSYEAIAAGQYMFRKMFPNVAGTGEAMGLLEKMIEESMITLSPAMIWPQLFGSPYNELARDRILNSIQSSEDQIFWDVHLFPDISVWGGNGRRAAGRIFEEIRTLGNRFLYLTCQPEFKGEYDKLTRKMLELAEKSGMKTDFGEGEGWFAYSIDEGFENQIREVLKGSGKK